MTSSPGAVRALVRALGYVQVDSINVLERAHHLILATRLEGYRSDHLSRNLERTRSLFEHWTHDASAIPVEWYGHWKHRFARYAMDDTRRAWWRGRFGDDPAPILRRTLERVRAEGPLRARDFDADSTGRGKGWWDWHPSKAALEHLWRVGTLAIARRDGFEKLYDLAERVLPHHHAQDGTDASAHDDWACREAIARLGVALPREVAAFFRALPLARVTAWCNAALARGEVVALDVHSESGRVVRCVARPDWRSFSRPRPTGSMLALCPFDPVVRDRDRLERLFGFDYRFEAFVPAPKRRYGYYVLPLLDGDAFVGRIDPKLDRERGVLTVRGPWWEPSASSGDRSTRSRGRRFGQAMDALARAVGASRWTLDRKRLANPNWPSAAE